ncbi:MAG: hypothetical protein ACXWQ6_08465 [Candidatus Limnocylindrales bacterium]
MASARRIVRIYVRGFAEPIEFHLSDDEIAAMARGRGLLGPQERKTSDELHGLAFQMLSDVLRSENEMITLVITGGDWFVRRSEVVAAYLSDPGAANRPEMGFRALDAAPGAGG